MSLNPLDLADSKKLSTIEKHPLVFLITVLFISVGTLFYLYLNLSHEFREHLTTANKVMIETLERNTSTMKATNDIIIKFVK